MVRSLTGLTIVSVLFETFGTPAPMELGAGTTCCTAIEVVFSESETLTLIVYVPVLAYMWINETDVP